MKKNILKSLGFRTIAVFVDEGKSKFIYYKILLEWIRVKKIKSDSLQTKSVPKYVQLRS